MALPKLNTPTHKLVLPSTGDEITFRPFLVKEQKLLLMAQQNDNENEIVDNVVQIINNCTGLDVSNLPVFDVEYLFLKIRAKSVGDIVQLSIKCPDDEETFADVTVDLDEVGVQIDESHSNIVNITDDIKMIMKYPQMTDIKLNNINTTETESVFEILKKCILEVHNGDEIINSVDMKPEEISEFIDSLNTQQFESIMQFFNTMPKVRHIIEVTNPKTKVTGEVLLEGLQSFLE
tara:strand:+ start:724 stop:1425 length:702 start_codon:yes stop_codon:yes gene_type:complete